VLRLGQHVLSDRDARLLAQHLHEVEHDLAADAARMSEAGGATGALCESARARVAEDIVLVSDALERVGSQS
jgi:hypothetical protein